jgi:pimeloyl-ACP methyl ester carboxylesterase
MIEPVETTIDVGSLHLACLDYSAHCRTPAADAVPVVLLHGQADSAWSMHWIAESLAERYRVYTLDQRGHGNSDRGAYTVLHMVGDLRGAVDALDLRSPVVMGHSLGGQVAAQFCGLYPDLPRALVLIEGLGPPVSRVRSGSADESEWAWARWVTEIVRRPIVSRSMPDIDDAVRRFRTAHPGLGKERARFLVERSIRDLDEGGIEWAFDPATRDWLAGHDHGRSEQRWRAITCPVQVVLGGDAWDRFWSERMIGGDADAVPMTPDEQQAQLRNFADLDFVVLDGAGHMVQYDRPDELNAEIARFLEARVPVTHLRPIDHRRGRISSPTCSSTS